MSASKVKKARQAKRARPTRDIRAAQLSAISARIALFDFAAAPETRVTQFAIGWMRAAFAQIAAIVQLSTQGLDYAAAPNRRSYIEIVLRFQWLHELALTDRQGALDAMVEDEKRQATNHEVHLAAMGVENVTDFTDLQAVVTAATDNAVIRKQASNFTEAAKATTDAAGLYRAWREETQNTHATGGLAVSYAPITAGLFGFGRPFVADPDFDSLTLTAFGVIAFAVRILLDEGTPQEVIDALFDAFFNGIEAGL